jgi:cysteinyl-tRNA synthetase
MSAHELGQPFDIHTGGVDLIFPHHENEIAQSTAGKDNDLLAKFFVHNEHLLVDGKKMSKSLNNFFTLDDIKKKGFDALAFRLMVLQSHYRSQSNFTWENLEAAQNRLKDLRTLSDLRYQIPNIYHLDKYKDQGESLKKVTNIIKTCVYNDIDLADALAEISKIQNNYEYIYEQSASIFEELLTTMDIILGLGLMHSKDITDEEKELIHKSEKLREDKRYEESDGIREQLRTERKLGLNQTVLGPIWYRL